MLRERNNTSLTKFGILPQDTKIIKPITNNQKLTTDNFVSWCLSGVLIKSVFVAWIVQ